MLGTNLIECNMVWRSQLFVCTLHYLIIIIMQTYLKVLKCLSGTFCPSVCLRLSQFSQLSFIQYMGLCAFIWWIDLFNQPCTRWSLVFYSEMWCYESYISSYPQKYALFWFALFWLYCLLLEDPCGSFIHIIRKCQWLATWKVNYHCEEAN